MVRVAPLLPTFARGEVSPLMYGRNDIEPYSSCLKKCRNFWVRPYGSVSRVAGTEFVANAKGYAKLLRFIISPTDSYIIECGAGYFRFSYNGAPVYKGGSIYEIANNFTQDDLKTIQYVQLDDIIKIVYRRDGSKDNRPKELIRKAADNWEFRDVDFVSTPYMTENLTETTITPSAVEGNITLTASADVFNSKHVGSFFWIGETTTVDGVKKQGFVNITGVTNAKTAAATVKWKLSGTTATKIWGEGAWSNYRGWPSVVGLLDGRLYYARTPTQPRNVYGSKPYKYEDFTPAVSNEEDGAVNIELATNIDGDGSDIKWIIGTSFLLAGTYGSEFVIKGSGDSGINSTTAPSARARSNWGSENIQPATIGSQVYFVQRTGKKVRRFEYDYYLDSYKAVDVSIFSEHLFDSPIVDICYQKNPDSIMWCLRADGKVAGLTVEQDQNVQAWCLLDWDDGFVETAEAIPSYNGLYDELYLIVKRTINGKVVRTVERIRDPITPENVVNCWYVRDGLRFNAFDQTSGNNLTLSGTTGTITATATADIFQAKHVGRRIRVVDADFNIIGQATITAVTGTKTATAKVTREFDKTSYSGGSWGVSVNNLSGFEHIENRTVQILADGAVQTDKVVAGGSFTLDLDSWVVLAGLGYRSYFTTMNIEEGAMNGTAVAKRKRINEVGIRLWRSLGGRIGSDMNNLNEISYREPSTPMGTARPLFSGIIDNIRYNQGWTTEADITVEQYRPLPLNVLALAPIVNEVDK